MVIVLDVGLDSSGVCESSEKSWVDPSSLSKISVVGASVRAIRLVASY